MLKRKYDNDGGMGRAEPGIISKRRARMSRFIGSRLMEQQYLLENREERRGE